jgi:hypothetical protein
VNFELFVSSMMTINTKARLWHWMTDIAQHHVTFETFLTQNETLTDSLMESAMGNDFELDLTKIGVRDGLESEYSIERAKGELKVYRETVIESKAYFEGSKQRGSEELMTILDGVVELTSKTLYLLRLK